MNIAKRTHIPFFALNLGSHMLGVTGAKRIGLLFSEAEVYWDLDPAFTIDIPDIKIGDEIFSDGCGLISKRLAMLLSQKKRIVYRTTRYTPSVFQIR